MYLDNRWFELGNVPCEYLMVLNDVTIVIHVLVEDFRYVLVYWV